MSTNRHKTEVMQCGQEHKKDNLFITSPGTGKATVRKSILNTLVYEQFSYVETNLHVYTNTYPSDALWSVSNSLAVVCTDQNTLADSLTHVSSNMRNERTFFSIGTKGSCRDCPENISVPQDILCGVGRCWGRPRALQAVHIACITCRFLWHSIRPQRSAPPQLLLSVKCTRQLRRSLSDIYLLAPNQLPYL